jgi:hypothetical protein
LCDDRAVRLFAVLLSLVGCAGSDPCDPFDGKSCISLEVRGALSVDQLEIDADEFALQHARTPPAARASPVALPVRVAVRPGDAYDGNFTLTVRGLVAGNAVGVGMARGSVPRGRHTPAIAMLASLGGAVDLAVPDGAQDLGARDLGARDLSGADLEVPCDPLTQAPCPTGQKCWAPAGLCLPDGTLPIGGLCSTGLANGDDCRRGLECDTYQAMMCTQYCVSDRDCTGPAFPIADLGADSRNRPRCEPTGVDGGLSRCDIPCNPVLALGASGCPDNSACRFFINSTDAGTDNEKTLCASAGALTEGADCSAQFFGCGQGLTCIGRCRRTCRFRVDADCPPGQTCIDIPADVNGLFGRCCPTGGC